MTTDDPRRAHMIDERAVVRRCRAVIGACVLMIAGLIAVAVVVTGDSVWMGLPVLGACVVAFVAFTAWALMASVQDPTPRLLPPYRERDLQQNPLIVDVFRDQLDGLPTAEHPLGSDR